MLAVGNGLFAGVFFVFHFVSYLLTCHQKVFMSMLAVSNGLFAGMTRRCLLLEMGYSPVCFLCFILVNIPSECVGVDYYYDACCW